MEKQIVNALGKEFTFTKGLNIVVGNNGSGKTRLINKFIETINTKTIINTLNKSELLNLYNEDLTNKIVVVDAIQAELKENELKDFAKFVSENKNCTFVISMTHNQDLYNADNTICLN